MKLHSDVVDERVTANEYRLIQKVASAEDMENAGERTPITEKYEYGSKSELPVEAAETVLKLVDDPSWETIAWEQSYLLGGMANLEGIERAVENVEQYQEEAPKRE